MAAKKPMDCLYGDSIPNLKATMDYLKEGFDELKSDLKEHIRSEDNQIDRIEKLIMDWQAQHNADSKEWRTYAENTFLKKDAAVLVIYTIAAIASVVGAIYGYLKIIHPTL